MALWRVPHVLVVVVGGGADGRASIERLCLSPYVEKLLNSKVIKSFVPELRSRKCFSCFGIPMFYVYMLRTFYVRFAYPYLAMVQDEEFNLSFLIIKLRKYEFRNNIYYYNYFYYCSHSSFYCFFYNFYFYVHFLSE